MRNLVIALAIVLGTLLAVCGTARADCGTHQFLAYKPRLQQIESIPVTDRTVWGGGRWTNTARWSPFELGGPPQGLPISLQACSDENVGSNARALQLFALWRSAILAQNKYGIYKSIAAGRISPKACAPLYGSFQFD